MPSQAVGSHLASTHSQVRSNTTKDAVICWASQVRPACNGRIDASQRVAGLATVTAGRNCKTWLRSIAVANTYCVVQPAAKPLGKPARNSARAVGSFMSNRPNLTCFQVQPRILIEYVGRHTRPALDCLPTKRVFANGSA